MAAASGALYATIFVQYKWFCFNCSIQPTQSNPTPPPPIPIFFFRVGKGLVDGGRWWSESRRGSVGCGRSRRRGRANERDQGGRTRRVLCCAFCAAGDPCPRDKGERAHLAAGVAVCSVPAMAITTHAVNYSDNISARVLRLSVCCGCWGLQLGPQTTFLLTTRHKNGVSCSWPLLYVPVLMMTMIRSLCWR